MTDALALAAVAVTWVGAPGGSSGMGTGVGMGGAVGVKGALATDHGPGATALTKRT